MKPIKNFIYLDEYKVFSISAQIFEGAVHSLTAFESIAKNQTSDTQQDVSDKEAKAIRDEEVIGTVLKSEFGQTKHKSLHDYSYNLFEEELRKSGKVVSLSLNNIETNITQLSDDKFIEVRGKVTFVDMNELRSIIGEFNKIGEAITNVNNFGKIDAINEAAEAKSQATKDRNEKAKIKETAKILINKIQSESPDLTLDKDYVKNLGIVLAYGFRDQFAIQMTIGSYIFWAECDANNFRENQDLLIRKFSRLPEKEFVIVGTISRSLNHAVIPIDDYQINKDEGTPQMKPAIMSVIQHLSLLESEFIGRQANEIIIDPIAVYWEI
jgi:hypothetical protein